MFIDWPFLELCIQGRRLCRRLGDDFEQVVAYADHVLDVPSDRVVQHQPALVARARETLLKARTEIAREIFGETM